MQAFRIYVGEGFDAEGFARHLVSNEIFGGATIIPTTGLWRDGMGKVHDEPGAIIELVESASRLDPLVGVLSHYTIPVWLDEHGEQSAMIQLPDGSFTFINARGRE